MILLLLYWLLSLIFQANCSAESHSNKLILIFESSKHSKHHWKNQSNYVLNVSQNLLKMCEKSTHFLRHVVVGYLEVLIIRFIESVEFVTTLISLIIRVFFNFLYVSLSADYKFEIVSWINFNIAKCLTLTNGIMLVVPCASNFLACSFDWRVNNFFKKF